LLFGTLIPSGRAQTQDVPDWIGNLVLANTNLITLSNPASSQEELPGLGHKFELLFAMMDDQDPQNPTNDVISVLTTPAYPAGIGVAFRNTPPGFKIAALDHQINLKYFFPTRRGRAPADPLAFRSRSTATATETSTPTRLATWGTRPSEQAASPASGTSST
jgi:hypothetical protein